MKSKVMYYGVCLLFLWATGSQAKNEPPVIPAYAAAMEQNRIESLADAGLADPATVWVPARYRDDGLPAFFIDGKQFVTPKGERAAAAWLPMRSGYLVAVLQTDVPLSEATAPTDRRTLNMVFYAVGSDGKVLSVQGSIAGVLPEAVVSEDGIFAKRPLGGGLYDYTGYSVEGKAVSGPQGVLFATPMPNGAWFTQVISKRLRNYAETAFYRIEADGGRTLLRDGFNLGMKDLEDSAANTAGGVFVNRPPLTDSARTGFFIRHRLTSSWSNTRINRSRWVIAYSMERGEAKTVRTKLFGRKETYTKTGHYTLLLGENQNVSPVESLDMVRRTVLAGGADKPIMLSQLHSSSMKRGLLLGYADLFAQENVEQHDTPVFQLDGGGGEVVRQLMGGNNSTLSMASRNDAYVVLTPHRVVMVLAYSPLRPVGGTGKAYDITSDKAVNRDDIGQFLVRYGITR